MILTNNVSWQKAFADGDLASGSSDVNGTTIDSRNFDCAVGVVVMGAISGTATVKFQGSRDNGTTWLDVPSSSVAVAADDDNETFLLEITKPGYDRLRLVVDKTGASAIASGHVLLGAARKVPVTHGTGVNNGGVVVYGPAS